MCRHLAYLGPETAIGELLVTPPHGLAAQAWAPRLQQYGSMNVDGFGVGWYAAGDRRPARYRRAGPLWADEGFADLARVVRTRALLAAVRSATTGCVPGEAAVAPFADGPWLFSHNGALPGWPTAFAKAAGELPPEDLLDLPARTDSALVWALVRHRLRAGAPAGPALAETCARLAEQGQARLNLLLTDGSSIAATTWGDTLCYRAAPGRGVVVASEPFDDAPGWHHLPDRSLLLATPESQAVRPLLP